MDNVVLKYSEFFEDDGGFDKVIQDFKNLGSEILKEAQKLKDGLDDINIFDGVQINKFEKAIDGLQDTFTGYKKAVDDVAESQENLNKQEEKGLKITKNQKKSLDELNVTLKQQQTALKIINQAEKDGALTVTDAAKARGRLKLEIKATTQEINRQQKEIIDSNKLSKEQVKLLKAEETLRKGQATTIQEIRERLSALRLVQSQINLTTEEGIQQNQEFVAEINDLTNQLEANSDKFIQNKINVGNYEESITNALGSTNQFQTGIGQLDAILGTVIASLTLSAEEVEELERGLQGGGNAVQRFIVRFGKLNKALRASIIGAVVLAVAGLASAFGDTRAGGARLEKFLLGLNQTLKSVGIFVRVIFDGVTDSFKNFFGTLESIGDEFEGLGFLEALDKLVSGEANIFQKLSDNAKAQVGITAKTFEDLGKVFDNQVEGIVKGLDQIDNAFKIQDQIAALDLEIVKLEGTLRKFQEAAGDDTRSLRERLALEDQVLQKQAEITEAAVKRANLEQQNILAQIEANVLQNEFEQENIDFTLEQTKLTEQILALAERRGQQLEISDDLIKQLQASEQELTRARLEGEAETLAIAARRNKVQLDLFEQNLDILLDIQEAERKVQVEAVNDQEDSLARRTANFQAFERRFQQNIGNQLAEFEKLQEALGKELDLDFQVDDDGTFEFLANGVPLAVTDLQELNEQLQGLGIGEIPVNRLREVLIDSTAAQQEFIGINKQLREAKVILEDLQAQTVIDEEELIKLNAINDQLFEISRIDFTTLTPEQRRAIEKQIVELEERKTQIEREAERKRLEQRLELLREEEARFEPGSPEFEKNQQAQLEAIKRLNELAAEDVKKSTEEGLKGATEAWERYEKEVNRVLSQVLDAFIDNQKKAVDAQQDRIDDQDKALDAQRSRAEQGLANTLAFEQRERAKEEAELQRRQRRLERLEKIRSLYAAFTANNNNPELQRIPGGALTRTLQDFAVLEAIAATFGEGGAVEDVLGKNGGIVRGRSHQGRMGGIPVLVEGKEGFFSAREMENLGKQNFYALKNMAGLGPIDRNFFSGQKNEFLAGLPVVSQKDPELVQEMREVKKAIKAKPSQILDVPEVVHGILRFTETVTEKNKVKRNHYRIQKPRL